MLIELFCDKICERDRTRSKILFHRGLNVILGDEEGSNSIGKSTFLLMLDFVFGGNDYIQKATDVQKNIGEHTIFFAFEFNNEKIYFSRNTVSNQEVSVCNNQYIEQSKISLENYQKKLASYYGIVQKDLSFRNVVSRYARIYQRENIDEKRPLTVIHSEKPQNSIIALLKLFDKYSNLMALEQQKKTAEQKFDIHKKAASYGFIPIIKNKKDFVEKQENLQKLQTAKENYIDPDELKNKSSEELLKIAEAKKRLQKERAEKSKLENLLNRVNATSIKKKNDFQEDFSELQALFPGIEMKSIEEAENFHKKLVKILNEEMKLEKSRLLSKIQDIDKKIQQDETELLSFDIPTGVSQKILVALSGIQHQIEDIKTQTANYEISEALKNEMAEYRVQYTEQLKNILLECSSDLNFTMRDLNDFIYDGLKKAPVIDLHEKDYVFTTPDDSGTGTSYKSLIVFDLSVLKLTNLPVIMHDSIILKNIADAPIEKILNLYTRSSKQIFIALDKASSYSTEAKKMLNNNAILHLSKNGKELFGRSWSNNPTEIQISSDSTFES